MAIFDEKIEIRERCKGVHCVDLGESFPTSIYLQNLASIQPRMSLVTFARSPRTDPPGTGTFCRLCSIPISENIHHSADFMTQPFRKTCLTWAHPKSTFAHKCIFTNVQDVAAEVYNFVESETHGRSVESWRRAWFFEIEHTSPLTPRSGSPASSFARPGL